jgi:homoserine O-acetyltransferase
MPGEHGGHLSKAFMNTPVRFCLISFTSDWLFPTSDSQAIVRALNAAAASVSFVEVQSDKGHDAFLLDEPELHDTIRGFLAGMAERAGLTFPETP